MIGLDTVVKGEANILRHVARCLPAEFQYESSKCPLHAAAVDAALDAAHYGFVWGDSRRLQEALKTVDAALKKQNSLTPGGALGIADYATWSAMVSSGAADARLASIAKWAKAVAEAAGKSGGGGGPGNKQRKNSNRTRRKTKSRGDSVSGGGGGGGGRGGKENLSPEKMMRTRRKSASKSKGGSPKP